jgi:Tol biopolymer transport system component
LAIGGSVAADFEFSPDGSRVLFAAPTNLSSRLELFAVATSGGEPLLLSGAMVAGGSVAPGTGRFTPDGGRVLYIADQLTDEQFELFSVDSNGGTAFRISGPLVEFGDVHPNYKISADGGRVAYVANAETDFLFSNIFELFSVSTAGGPVVKLNGPLPNAGDVEFGSQRFSADGNRVFYLANQNSSTQREFYSVASTGGASVKLNGPLIPDGHVHLSYDVSADGARVLYTGETGYTPFFQPIVEIYSVGATGGTPVKLNGPLVNGGNVVPGSRRFSPNGALAIYLADEVTNDVVELFAVESGGGGRVKLNGPLAPEGNVMLSGLQFSPDGARVLYAANQNNPSVTELFSVPAFGGEALPLTGATGTFSAVDLASVAFSPDGGQVIFRGIENGKSTYELFGVTSAGGTPLRLNDVLVEGGRVLQAGFSPDGNWLVYLADQESVGTYELFGMPAAGDSAPIKLSGDLVAGGNVTHWRFSPDGRYLVFRADQEEDGVFELFSMDLGVGEDPNTLDGDFNRDGIVDAADYTVWRNGLGSGYEEIHYGVWKEHYGRRMGEDGGGSAEASRVPEPASLGLLAMMVCLIGLRLGRWRHGF